MVGRDAPQPAGFDRVIATIAAALLCLLYIVVVSRAEVLTEIGPVRALAAPLLALLAGGLIVWRLRRPLATLAGDRGVRWTVVALTGLALAALLRLMVGPLGRPAAPAEAAIVADAIAIMRNELPIATTPGGLALAWLQAPVSAYVYVAGVSSGLWEGIKYVTVEATIPVSRALHLGLALATIGLTGLVAARLAGVAAGWLAAVLLAVSGPSVVAATTVDAGAPLSLLVALALLALATWWGRRAGLAGCPWSLLGLLAVTALVALWWPGPLAVALAPLAAVVAAVALAALWSTWRARSGHAAAA